MNFDLRTVLMSIVKICETIYHTSTPNCKKPDNQIFKYLNDYRHKIIEKISTDDIVSDMIREDVKMMVDDITRELASGTLSLATQTVTLKWDYKSKSVKSPRIMFSSFYRYASMVGQSNPLIRLEMDKYNCELLLYIYELAHIVSDDQFRTIIESQITKLQTTLGWREKSFNFNNILGNLKNLNIKENLNGILRQAKESGFKELISTVASQIDPSLKDSIKEIASEMSKDENLKTIFKDLYQEHKELDDNLKASSSDDPLERPDSE